MVNIGNQVYPITGTPCPRNCLIAAAVAFGEGGGTGRDQPWVGRVIELALQPERAAIVHQVDDWRNLEIADDIGNHRIGPAPVEFARPPLGHKRILDTAGPDKLLGPRPYLQLSHT